MSEIETYDEPSNGDPLDETVQGTTDYEAYARLMNDLQEERKARVEIQAECDKYKRMTRTLANLVDALAIEIVGVDSGEASMEGLLMHARSILDSDDSNHGGNVP